MFNAVDVEKQALEIRQKNNIQTYGIKDIFSLIEDMGIDMIRYPFGKEVLCGLSSVYRDKKVIISNSSEILTREIFTVAHELGHLIYDFDQNRQGVKVDVDIENDLRNSVSEERADYFAACLLMPKEKIENFIRYELKKSLDDIKALDIVRMQGEFNTSYASTVLRLTELGLIRKVQKNQLFDERNQKSSMLLFRMINADEGLLRATEKIEVPTRYLYYLVSNYENGFVPYTALEKAFNLIGKSPAEEFNNKGEEFDEDEMEENLDEVFEY